MSPSKVSVDEIDVRGKRVFLRADFNVPLDGDLHITDDRRIRLSLPTINYLIDEGAKVIIGSHLGRPKGKVDPKYSMAPVAKRLSRLLNKDIRFSDQVVGPVVEREVEKMEAGGVLLLENLRFNAGEESNDPEFSRQLSLLCDVYVNDAFGTAHRAHASVVGLPSLLKTVAIGFLMKKEVNYLQGAVSSPTRPFVAVLGGGKVSGKLGVIANLQEKVDKIIIGGGMAFTFYKAMGFEIGDSLVEDNLLHIPLEMLEKSRKGGFKLYLPVDCIVAESRDPAAPTKIVPYQEIPKGWTGLDIGPASVRLFSEVLDNAKTILWNGPMGVFEIDAYSRGTFAMAHAVANSYALTVVGGGDTALAVYRAGEADNMTFISTGGGAALELLEGKELPGLKAIPDNEH
ncbi:phosphoglycerate kinase [Leptospirillum ferriphilum]|jgi:phosphoglycerate kinase|uniref:Phosphoglycerate kinase n=4 Tax=Leptospirillum TaxID=179 RepID=A0A059XX97_9BACT|nr:MULTISPECIES: phosphoglycerate kinase [Leptospirillum]EAY57968.1 MAG: phosphoglycerate kinase [Leptospirillum rubarum]EDZ39781.1 MAG: Phosphoglycerate kinase [Leptospirillum sp. Group II '5-way CG']EIJ77313.1 MAG: Phosphoglycerate kinase [Leptospirillum sp. Group II 'C75']AFS52324.1 3-phosphoglycerate kinase [Leptospirillum ferriphilum ML-04]AIA29842.1 phosphoglycerate kinase [Leptospirillum ferriphilum YSK]